MRAILQRTNRAEVRVEGEVKGKIDQGLVILLGVEEADAEDDIQWLSGKIAKMRIFEDEERKMNKSLMDIGGRILLISQFTLHASVKKGNRPSFIKAAKPEKSIPVYNKVKKQLEEDTNTIVETGEFGAFMEVDFINDGPVTIFLDTKNKE
ncbi:MAG: D-tyrosyl-tRNA(Tyr) deacylase [Bacteroidales bacterium]|nr:D-tyrosyl-tRNA(Tyr) deacylase [Bacteroidales bacterium]MCF8327246.1 D-tyrosyl-tRNA(Tyr) deacylase [Bacteroidales bacterium]